MDGSSAFLSLCSDGTGRIHVIESEEKETAMEALHRTYPDLYGKEYDEKEMDRRSTCKMGFMERPPWESEE